MEEYTGPRIPEQQQISDQHQQMISDLQSIVKDLKDLYRNSDLDKEDEKDDDITTISIKEYDKKQSDKANITLGVEDIDKSILELKNSIKNDLKSNKANSHKDDTITNWKEFSDLKDKIKKKR